MSGTPRRAPFSRLGVTSLIKDEKIAAALDVLKQRGVKNDYCPRCEHLDWNVDIIEIPAESPLLPSFLGAFKPSAPTEMNYSAFSSVEPKSGVIHLLAVVCRNCGYTMFHNLDTLGVSVR